MLNYSETRLRWRHLHQKTTLFLTGAASSSMFTDNVFMRIVGKQKDYYDSAISANASKELMYIRDEKEVYSGDKTFNVVNLPLFPHNLKVPASYKYKQAWYIGVDDNPVFVGFCGKMYVGIKITYYNYADARMRADLDKHEDLNHYWKRSYYGVNKYCYSIEEMDEFIKTNCPTVPWNDKRGKFDTNGQYDHQFKRANFVAFFNEVATLKDKYGEWFDKFKTPVFSFQKDKYRDNDNHIVLNPVLEEFGFYSVFDSFAAYQELEMYLGNQASPENAMVKISNENLIAKHGFNQFSFRNDSPGKKKNRSKNKK